MPQATGLVVELEAQFPHITFEATLTEGSGGVFEVAIDGKDYFSKKSKDRFPMYQEIPTLLKENLG